MRLFRTLSAAALLIAAAGAAKAQENTLAESRALLASLMPKLVLEDADERKNAEQELQVACWQAGAPGNEARRQSICTAIAETLEDTLPQYTALWLIRQLRHVGREECVPALAALLDSSDPRIRERARRALQNNPSPQAGEALRQNLEKAAAADWQLALLNALAERADTASADAFLDHSRSESPQVAVAAARGLANLGHPDADAAIRHASARHPQAATALTDARIQLADTFVTNGQTDAALAIFRSLLQADGHVRCAALVGLGKAGEAHDLPVILAALEDNNPQIQGAAQAALALMPAKTVLPTIRTTLPGASPKLRAALLKALADSGDPDALPVFTAAAADHDPDARIAAFNGMARLGSPRAAPVLVNAIVAEAEERCRDAAKAALALIGGNEVIAAITQGLETAEPEGRRQLVDILVTRPSPLVADILLRQAAGDPDPEVRVAALHGVGKTATVDHLDDVVKRLLEARTDGEREAAREAIVAISRRADDLDQCAAILLDMIPQAGATARAPILRALGCVGGETALETVTAAWQDNDDNIRKAALDALCDWPNAEAAPQLLNIARTAENLVHKVLAIRGLVDIVRADEALAPGAKLAYLNEAMAAAPRNDERRLVLGGLADVPHEDALRQTLEHLDDPALKQEAGAAVVSIAGALQWTFPEEVEKALQHVLDTELPDAVQKNAQALLKRIETYDGYVQLWLAAGPYTQKGKGGQALFDVAFPPENPNEAADVTWQRATTGTNADQSWYVPFDTVLKGSNRVAYLRTRLQVPDATPARIEMGSDDGLKAWLNSTPIAADKAARAIAPAQTVAPATLEPGWNELLMKITQEGGYWAGAARVRAPDGTRIPNLTELDAATALAAAAADMDAERHPERAVRAALDIIAVGNTPPTVAVKALRQMLTKLPEGPARKRCQTLLDDLTAHEDHILEWNLAGPYTKTGVEGAALMDVVFPPEKNPDTVDWEPVPVSTAASRPYIVDLGRLIGGDNRVAYLRARIRVPTALQATMELGSDDGVVVWINGEEVHRNPTPRPVSPSEDKTTVALRAGTNTVLMKVVQYAGNWAACLRFRTAEGNHIDGLDILPAAP